MIEILLPDSYLQTFINFSFRTSEITNTDYIHVLFVFISLLTLYSVAFRSTEIKASDWLIEWLTDWLAVDGKPVGNASENIMFQIPSVGRAEALVEY